MPILTILYAALVVGVSDCLTQKEIVPMSRTLAALASLVLIVLGVVFLYPPDCAHACSCMGVSTQRLLSSSEAVFSGEVVDIKKNQKNPAAPPPPDPESNDNAPPSPPSYPVDRVSFRVSEVWKGPQRETLEVITPNIGAACGYPFKEGQEYLVYAYGKGEPFETDICNGTHTLSKADEDLAFLGNGEKPMDGGDALTDTSGVVPAWAVVGLAGLAMLASFLVVVRLVRTG